MSVFVPDGPHQEMMKELRHQSALLAEINAKLAKITPIDDPVETKFIPEVKPPNNVREKKKGR